MEEYEGACMSRGRFNNKWRQRALELGRLSHRNEITADTVTRVAERVVLEDEPCLRVGLQSFRLHLFRHLVLRTRGPGTCNLAEYDD